MNDNEIDAVLHALSGVVLCMTQPGKEPCGHASRIQEATTQRRSKRYLCPCCYKAFNRESAPRDSTHDCDGTPL